MNNLKDIPAWVVLSALFILLMIGYYIRPDNVTEDSAKGILAALLLSLRPNQNTPTPNP